VPVAPLRRFQPSSPSSQCRRCKARPKEKLNSTARYRAGDGAQILGRLHIAQSAGQKNDPGTAAGTADANNRVASHFIRTGCCGQSLPESTMFASAASPPTNSMFVQCIKTRHAAPPRSLRNGFDQMIAVH